MARLRPPYKAIFKNPPPTTNAPGPKSSKVVIRGKEVVIEFEDGRTIDMSKLIDVLERLEALETIYMEEKLLGIKDE